MKNGFSPELFENPVLHTMWKAMEGLALDRDETETVVDTTMPDNDRIDRKIAKFSEKFNELVYPFEQELGTTQKNNPTLGSLKSSNIDVETEARNGSVSISSFFFIQDDFLSRDKFETLIKKFNCLQIIFLM